MLLIGAMVVLRSVTRTSAAVPVSLVAYRGLEAPNVPMNRPLHVVLEGNGLGAKNVVVQLVDKDGQQVWESRASVRENTIALEVPSIKESGPHFFRIYAGNGTTEGDLLREFALEAK